MISFTCLNLDRNNPVYDPDDLASKYTSVSFYKTAKQSTGRFWGIIHKYFPVLHLIPWLDGCAKTQGLSFTE